MTAIESAAESSYSSLGKVMDEAYPIQLEVLRADGANVRLMTDEEVSFWEETTNYRAIQDKYISEHDNAADALEALRKRIAQ